MEDISTFLAKNRYAAVTGANKGIGLGICKQLAEKGVTVVLTARDEKRGIEAVAKLRESGLSDFILFHQLDAADPASIASLADFIKSQFGKLDILEYLRIRGAIADDGSIKASDFGKPGAQVNWTQMLTQAHELAEEGPQDKLLWCQKNVRSTNSPPPVI
ncbi:hypothetical protein SLEP1_g24156 [Rubroshorea leprosula]|uniref:(+)-neomenthol dehydrogenase-like n=1 Tax=Rubroshorea leprosula TaxID=152421 RepID=A0AAV5JRU9_9ROSI|nr:hypothetical protein SLEP1_g24156 [Rubroshorea leprosula]